MLITVSGIDCSGKSTQIELLAEALRARGRRVRTVWLRPGYSPEMDALRRVVRRLRPGMIPPPGPSTGREKTFARPVVARSWLAMALGDTVLQYALKLRRWLWAGWDVICDRYLLDARLDLLLRFPAERATIELALDLAVRICPRPDVAFLLTLTHEAMLERMALKNEPFPDAPALRDQRYDAYMELAAGGAVRAVDADRSIEAVSQAMLQQLPAEQHQVGPRGQA